MSKETDLKIRVKWKCTINGNPSSGIDTEASWFTFDQRGGVYAQGPFSTPSICNQDYDELIPLIKIKENYLSVKQIEAMIDTFEAQNRGLK